MLLHNGDIMEAAMNAKVVSTAESVSSVARQIERSSIGGWLVDDEVDYDNGST